MRQAFAEYLDGVRLGRVPACDWSWLAVLELTAEEEVLWVRLAAELGTGEAACIACAVTRGLSVFTDDRDARRTALQLHVPISGTLGLLLRLIDLDVVSLTEANALLANMIARGYRAPVTSLAELR